MIAPKPLELVRVSIASGAGDLSGVRAATARQERPEAVEDIFGFKKVVLGPQISRLAAKRPDAVAVDVEVWPSTPGDGAKIVAVHFADGSAVDATGYQNLAGEWNKADHAFEENDDPSPSPEMRAFADRVRNGIKYASNLEEAMSRAKAEAYKLFGVTGQDGKLSLPPVVKNTLVSIYETEKKRRENA